MKIQTSTQTFVELTKSAEEWRQVLVDAKPFQTELRAVLAQIVQANGNGHGTFALDSNLPLPAGSIEAAAERQNRRFLGKRGKRGKKQTAAQAGKVPCPKCGKPIKDNPKGWGLHNAKAHKSSAQNAAHSANAPSAA